ncbi:MAG: hypothetical protein KDA05_05820 [Phycisphaerales bacterium]|nr:hypothetical protein [Phycisphaerales bacterium]
MLSQSPRTNRNTRSGSAARLILVAGLAAASAAPALAQGARPAARQPGGQDAELPMTAITLYRSGVGAFQRQGFVEGAARVQLRFDTDQINDILKSMVLLDLGGGRIDAVSYASREPLERRLASFAIDISSNPSMAELFAQLRGARVRVASVDGETTGTVIGVENRPVGVGDNVAEHPFVNILSSAGIRSVDITALRSFDILDPELAGELERALTAYAEQRTENVKTVDLSFDGAGNREVFVAYVHEMPVWKTSYRLILPEMGGGGGQPTLQGWAIVENTTDEDWNQVELSLVAGQPVGFQMDLYEPLFLTRPEVPVPVIANVGPTVYERGRATMRGGGGQSAFQEADAEGMIADRTAGEARFAAPASAPGLAARRSAVGGDQMANYAAAAQARAGEVGEVFQYTIDTPVSIDRQRSAMIPIITSVLDGRRVSIYSRGVMTDHPMRGVELTNSSSLQLLPGPIAVYDGAAYAGDAQIGHIVPGDKRLLSYAVDLDVDVRTEDKGDWQVRNIRIVDGLIEQTVRQVSTVVYSIENKDRAGDRTVIVEQPRMGGYELTAPSQAAETTESLYRFEVEVAGGETESLTVTQERTTAQRITLLSWDLNTFLEHQRNGRVSQAVIDAFRTAAGKQRAIQEQQRIIERLETERNEIGRDQARMRENMGRLDRNNELYARYVQTMTQQENRLEAINTEMAAARQRQAAAEADLEAYLRNLNVQ